MFRNLVRIALLGYSLAGSAALAENGNPASYQNPNHGASGPVSTAKRPAPQGSYQNPNQLNHRNRATAPGQASSPRLTNEQRPLPGQIPANQNSPAYSELENLYHYNAAGSGQVRSTSIAPQLTTIDKSMSSLTLCTANGAQGQQGIVLFHFFNALKDSKETFRFGVIAQPIEKIVEPAKFRVRADDAVRVLSDVSKYSADEVKDAKMIEQLVQLNRERFKDAEATPSLARLSIQTPIKDQALYYHRFSGVTMPGGLKGDKTEGPYTSYSIRQVQLPITGQRTFVIRVEEGTQKWNSLKNDYDRTPSRTLYCR